MSKPSRVQSPTEDKLDSLAEKLDELVAWTKFEQMNAFLRVLSKELDEPKKLLAYENTSGTNSMQDVADSAGVPKPTIQGWWRQWSRAGIVRSSTNHKGRMQRMISLEDFGLISDDLRPTAKGRVVSSSSTPSLDTVLKQEDTSKATNQDTPKNGSKEEAVPIG